MPQQADAGWSPRPEGVEVPPPPPQAPRRRTPLLLGAAAAVAASGALAWWLALPERAAYHVPAVEQLQPQAAAARAAPREADAEQVRRAYEDFRTVYAQGGRPALARFEASCHASLAADPRILDFCLGFDLFAEALQPTADAPAAAEAPADQLDRVRAALPPGADPADRIRQVRAIMRDVSGASTSARPTSPAPRSPPAPAPAVQPPAQAARPNVARPPPAARPGAPHAQAPVTRHKRARVPTSGARAGRAAHAAQTAQAGKRRSPVCHSGPRADRLVCASPVLRAQHRRMRQAYDQALSAGADPLTVDRGQAQWRALRAAAKTPAELKALYARRIRQLRVEAMQARAARRN